MLVTLVEVTGLTFHKVRQAAHVVGLKNTQKKTHKTQERWSNINNKNNQYIVFFRRYRMTNYSKIFIKSFFF